jgi:hypothetical protein
VDPITFGAIARSEAVGGYVDVSIWAGRDVGSRGFCGRIKMRPDEAEEFVRLLARHQVDVTTKTG